MRIRLAAFGAVILAASVGVVWGQQRPAPHSGTHATRPHQVPHQTCDTHHPTGAGANHHADMPASLELTADQRSTIERITSEACAAMAKYHEQILAVLTPEQRVKMQEHHGTTGHADPAHAGIRKHGGR